MNVQYLSTGRWYVTYGEPMEYVSPLMVRDNLPSLVTYINPDNGDFVGKVYRVADKWYLASGYLDHWQPVEVFAKYEGFLLLYNLHKQHYLK